MSSFLFAKPPSKDGGLVFYMVYCAHSMGVEREIVR